MSCATSPRVLFLDAHDSFTNNIVSLLETRLSGVEVTVIKIDQHILDFPSFLRNYDAVVAGPGPGHPGNATNVGLIAQLWRLSDQHVLPALGICLGFQSLVLAFGGSVVPLPNPRHGIVRKVTSNNTSIFEGITDISPVQYHSLHAILHQNTFRPEEPLKSDHDLEALAWDVEADNQDPNQTIAHNANPGAILMAVKHRTKPFYGLQFHPESICSDQAAQQLVDNWWTEAQRWNRQRKAQTHLHAVEKAVCERSQKMSDSSVLINDLQELSLPDMHDPIAGCDIITSPPLADSYPCRVISRTLPLDGLTVPRIWDLLQLDDGNAVVLDAEPHQRADIGTHSAIGILGPSTIKLEYSVGSGKVNFRQGAHQYSIDLSSLDNTIFGYLKAFMSARKAIGGDPNIPFWGGLVGYINYEACLETIDMTTPSHSDKPDISLVFVERSVVVDHQRQQLHVQSILPEDSDWIKMISLKLSTWATPVCRPRSVPIDRSILKSVITYPDSTSYMKKIRKCQDYIHSGDSYELCLTNQASINASHLCNPWPLYLHLRSLNAAPFSTYMRLGGMTLLSSSPERFMRWTRPGISDASTAETSTVQFRPIKGTVKRFPNGHDGPAITLQEATALLSSSKERAENLMIVDLIRHDLHGVVGSGNVCVPKLMVVEEYATLFQLVTVVEGTLINHSPTNLSNVPSLTTSPNSSPGTSRPVTPSSSSSSSVSSVASRNRTTRHRTVATDKPTPPPPPTTNKKTGIDVLAASLPPGSMTGAPKRRSCALLREIEEEHPRGIYSGVVGYMDVGGGGDFSVVIRSAFRWDGDSVYGHDDAEGKGQKEKRDVWTVGAGGAITALSTEVGEWEEMGAKLGSTVRMFE